MRRKLRTLLAKQGHNPCGNPRQLIEETVYREHLNNVNANLVGSSPHWDPQYSGWSNPSRSRDHAIFLRSGAAGEGPTPPSQFVALRTAGNFAIFAQSGITTTGGSDVNGDMGINPAAAASITGFALVLDASNQFSTSSQVHPGTPAAPYLPQLGHVFAPDYADPTPAKVVQASADMITAYNDAAGRVADVTHAGGDIFADSPLSGGLVYKYTGASSVTAGVLTINGNASDGVIIQVAGTLAIHHDIVLIGGILPQNVYLAVAGAVTIFPGVTVNAEILSAQGIAMQAGAVLNGRALAQTAVTLISNTINAT